MLESSTSISVERATFPFAFEAALFFDQGGEEEGLIEEEGEGKEEGVEEGKVAGEAEGVVALDHAEKIGYSSEGEVGGVCEWGEQEDEGGQGEHESAEPDRGEEKGTGVALGRAFGEALLPAGPKFARAVGEHAHVNEALSEKGASGDFKVLEVSAEVEVFEDLISHDGMGADLFVMSFAEEKGLPEEGRRAVPNGREGVAAGEHEDIEEGGEFFVGSRDGVVRTEGVDLGVSRGELLEGGEGALL